MPVTSPHVHSAQASPPGRADATRDTAGCIRVSRLCSASPSAAARGASAGAARPGRAAAAVAPWAEGSRPPGWLPSRPRARREEARVQQLSEALRNSAQLSDSQASRALLLGARRNRDAFVMSPGSGPDVSAAFSDSVLAEKAEVLPFCCQTEAAGRVPHSAPVDM